MAFLHELIQCSYLRKKYLVQKLIKSAIQHACKFFIIQVFCYQDIQVVMRCICSNDKVQLFLVFYYKHFLSSFY